MVTLGKQADEAVAEAIRNLRKIDTLVDASFTYGTGCGLIDIGYTPVMERAIEIRRKGYWDRAASIEMAFDALLAAGKTWQRTGEVIMLKDEGVARAFCTTHGEEANVS